MVKIPEITITESAGFFTGKNFSWLHIKHFSIITGINGSGKTQLLEYIANHFGMSCLIRYIAAHYQPPSEKHANILENNYRFSIHNDDGKYYSINKKDGQRNDWTNSVANFKNNNILETLDYAIIDNMIQERKLVQNKSDLIRAELDRIDDYKVELDIQKLLPANKNDDLPWDRIDRILSAFNLLIRVDRTNLNAGLEFLRRSKSGANETILEMKHLSSGEKVAFALALWTWGNSKGQKTDVLLIDEFDAHLNPSIAEKFIGVIKEYFVDLGVQVIMTTHHPSTVAFAHSAEADIIWMEDGNIDFEMSYEDIIRVLSNGLIDINYLTEEIQLLIQNRERCVIYTEGKTDKKHLENAIKVLGREKDFENHYIFGCTGASTVPFFASLQTGQNKRIILLDNDAEGKKVYQQIMANLNLKKKIDEGKLSVVFVSSENNKVIEDLFSSELRKKYKKKEKFVSYMTQPANLTKINFANFTTLLNEILI